MRLRMCRARRPPRPYAALFNTTTGSTLNKIKAGAELAAAMRAPFDADHHRVFDVGVALYREATYPLCLGQGLRKWPGGVDRMRIGQLRIVLTERGGDLRRRI